MAIPLLLLALAATLPGWLLSDKARVHLIGAVVGTVLLAALGLWMLYDPSYSAGGDAVRGTLGLLFGILAILGGGPVTAAALHQVDVGEAMLPVGNVLRGGAWIGAMERAAIFATVLAGWPEGLAVVLALKGLGRYPELKTPGTGAAERFIIGTFASVLWALACAGVLIALLH